MALRRLLLYANGNSTSEVNYGFDGNTTLDCIVNCVGVCIYGLCFPPPPLSSVSLTNDTDAGNSTVSVELHRRDRFLSSLIITIVSAVVGSFALLTIYAYFSFRRRRRRRRHPPDAAPSIGDNSGEDEAGGDFPPGGEIEHHIWYIRTQGLDDSTIASITSWMYKSSDGLIDCRDCSVCLGEFHDGELVRLLPKCSHTFHLSCIDKWLRSHVNCPLCRSPIVYPATVPVPAPSIASSHFAVVSVPAEPEFGSPSSTEIAQIEALPWENVSGGIQMGVMSHPSEGSSSRPSTSELPPNSLEEGEGLQPIRPSISMNSLSMHSLAREERSDQEFHQEEGRTPANNNKSSGFLKGNLLRNLPRNMERSLSNRSARWFFSRYGRPGNSVLPL